MWPLKDITVYYHGTKIKDAPEDLTFRKTVNYISDFYHNSLDGYKPPKTARICIRIEDQPYKKEPEYFGAICEIQTKMNEEIYLSLDKTNQYEYLLDLIHNTLTQVGRQLNWNLEIFDSAYSRIKNSNFEFTRHYEVKQSRNKKNKAQTILTKTESNLNISILLKGSISKEVKLLEKKNWFWYDSSYDIAKSCKWIDKNKFGYTNKECDKFIYYSLENDSIESNMQFNDEIF